MKNILWVEDNLDAVFSIASALHFAGNVVTMVRTRKEAIQLLDGQWTGDLILLDSLMPDDEQRHVHSGCYLFRDLRSGKWGQWGQQVPVIFVTAYVQNVIDNTKGVEPTADILSKPVSRETVLNQIQKNVPGLVVVADHEANVKVNLGTALEEGVHVVVAFPLPTDCLAELKRLAMLWVSDGNINAIDAAQRLLSVVTATDEIRQRESVDGFVTWLSSKGDGIKEGLRTSALSVSIAKPIVQLMGLVD